jgi:molybdenum cofactor guanylyltransferase
MQQKSIPGVILAGGKSLRMGVDKALIQFQGRLMINYIVDTLRKVCTEVIIVADNLPLIPGTSRIADRVKGCGPLGGLHAAFQQLDVPEIFVLPCDTPFVCTELIRFIISQRQSADAAVALTDGRIHPLCGVYASTCRPVIERQLQCGNNSMMGLLERVQTRLVEIPKHVPWYSKNLLLNFNDRQSLQRFTEA